MRWPGRRRGRPSEITLVTRAGCTQCAEVAPLVTRLAAEAGVPLQVRDVDTDPGIAATDRRRWGERVPVVLLDGEEHAAWTVSEPRLRRALAR